MDKLISVVIPVYNVETTLQKCVDSVLAQTYDNTEVIRLDRQLRGNMPPL